MIELAMKETRGIGKLALAFGVVSALAWGCDGQADPDYRGEPLMRVSGRVEAGLSVGDVEVGVLWLLAAGDFALECTGEANADGEPSACAIACGEVTCETQAAWEDCVNSCPDVTFVMSHVTTTTNPFITGAAGQTTPAVGEFPAQFSLDILEPPPDEALIASSSGEHLAIGLLVALDPAGAPFRFALTEPRVYPDWLLGGSETHLVAYTPDGVPEGSLFTLATGLELEPGFSLVEDIGAEDDDSEEEPPPPRVVPDGDASQVSLRIAPPDTLSWPMGF